MILLGFVLAARSGTALAKTPATTVEGEVIDVTSRWTAAGDRIVSDVTVRRDDGSEVVLFQLGGTVNGIGMTTWHAPVTPLVGERVIADYSEARTLSGRAVNRVDTMTQLATGADRAFFVNTRTRQSREPLHWASGCAFIAFHEDGTSHLDNEVAVMLDVLDTWENGIDDCSYMRFELAGTSTAEVGYDGVNIILYREDRWCRPATAEDPEMCYSSAAAALTTLFFVDDPGNDRDGEIVDADIEMNALNFAISDQGASNGSPNCFADLANTLTHEVGHLLGLDHTCWDGIPPRPVDENGDSVPSCSPESALSQEIKDATMYNFQTCGETKKATPEQDDLDAICALYPLGEDPGHCRPVALTTSGGCCSTALGARLIGPRPGAGSALLCALAFLLLAVSRRRRIYRSVSNNRVP